MTYLEFIPKKTYSGKLSVIKTKKDPQVTSA